MERSRCLQSLMDTTTLAHSTCGHLDLPRVFVGVWSADCLGCSCPPARERLDSQEKQLRGPFGRAITRAHVLAAALACQQEPADPTAQSVSLNQFGRPELRIEIDRRIEAV